MEGNLFAYVVLAACPIVSLVLVALLRAPIACAIIVFAGQMFLPPSTAFDAPFVPPINKELLAPLSALFACLVLRPRTLQNARPGRGYDLFIVLQIVGYFGTVLTNRDPVRFGPLLLPGHTLHDGMAAGVQTILSWWPPFFLGRTLYRNAKDLKKLFVVMACAGIVYTPFLLLEMRLSPQLNMWIYGFHQSDFMQTIRGGSFRPKVFMRHGLNVALFMAFTALAAGVLARVKYRVLGINAWVVMLLLLGFVILCRSAGAITYTIVFLPLVLYASARAQTRVAAVLAMLMFAYPVCRSAGLVPIDAINNFVLSVFGGDRAQSLAYRLKYEGLVMERALKRILFGWGGYARPFPHDPDTGKDFFAIDGLWVIVIGSRGVVGFTAIFGMLVLPIWRARHTLVRIPEPRDRVLVGSLALMGVIFVTDLIPNASVDPYLTFLIGVLAGTERGFDPPSSA